MTTPAPTTAKSPAQLGNMPFRAKRLTEDVNNWIRSAHALNIAMSVEQHAAAVVIRAKMRGAARGLDRFQASQAARRATRPLMRAASQSDAAAKSNLRCWRAYTIVAAELQQLKNRHRRR